MKLVKTLLFFTALILSGSLSAQDIHWSMYNMSPLTLNPANTGAFEGTFRIGGIYRDQWASVIDNPFRTPSIYVDAPIVQGFRKKDWVGIGAVLYSDKAGAGDLGVTSTMLSAAYHIAMNKKGSSYLTIGAQGGMVQRKIDEMDLQFEDELIDNNPGQSLDRTRVGEDTRYLDFSAGLLLTSQLNKTSDLEIGLAFKHLTTPNYGLINNSDDNLPLRITAHGILNAALSEKWMISPSFLFNSISSLNEVAVQALAGYHLTPKKDITLRFGAGYRLQDAVEVLIGIDYKQFKFGAAYDINTSDLTQVSNNQGGFEIALSYIARIYKNPTVKPVIFCPRF